MWGFLSEFWEAITGIGEYTIQWFQNIGLAVAGAIGNLFSFIIHYVSDFFIFLGWLFQALKQLTLAITLPISYVGSFLRAFVVNATQNPTTPETNYTFATSTMSVFQAIPYWSSISAVLGIGILVICGIGILYLILRI